VFKDGSVFEPSILDISDADVLTKFSFGIRQLAALSLQITVPTVAAVPHYFASAYKNILAISIATDYTFERAEKIKALLSDPEAMAAALAAAAAAAAPAAASTSTAAVAAAAPKEDKKPKEEPKEEEEDEGGFGDLFG